ncbi:hypothetical protein LTR56_010701 [Elasticomyces elasticus]|nr:hypothetical protein LTR56_010701 [Elasticomyces elasticus]KAK3655365.1 hypothetical protein LTR22_010250 [Elasticomyces elasticus]KAK4922099.1 hypothetical protein LTR49_010510 [Elasticomyces elasticus]KAK5750966.1 hypothetical protein LTS12_018956 [Elasticomyces elasticus]
MFVNSHGLLPCVSLLGLIFLQATTISAQDLSWCATSNGHGTSGSNFTILPMGASIVYGLKSSDGNGFRLGLQDLLQANGTQTSMVGTQSSGDMSDPFHEAYQGVTIDGYNNKSYHSGAYDMGANIVLVLIGTNDCWYISAKNDVYDDPRHGAGIEAALRFGNLLGSIKTKLPDALVLAAELPRNTNQWADRCILGFNSQLPDVVRDAAQQGQHIKFVEMYDVVPAGQIQEDGTHPTDHGYQLMAQQWYDAVANATQELCVERNTRPTGSTTSSIPSTATGTASTSSTATGTASRTASAAESTNSPSQSGGDGQSKSVSSAGTLSPRHTLGVLIAIVTWAYVA